MVTAIVRKVQAMLRSAGRSDVAVEIVFPVASEAITTSANSPADANPGAFYTACAKKAEELSGCAVSWVCW